MAVAKPTRRERERNQHEQDILDAAERVFCRDGFQHGSIQTIAAEAEFSVGTLYNFFKGKDEIYEQMMERKAREIVAYYRREAEGDWGPEETIRRLLAAKTRYFGENRDFFRVYVTEICGGQACKVNSNMSAAVQAIIQEHLDWVSGVFQAGIDDGVFHADLDPSQLARYLQGLSNAMMQLNLEDATGEHLEHNLANMTRLFFNGACTSGRGDA